MNVIERVARVLAGQFYSRNAGGTEEHAADLVDREWPHFAADALAVMKTLREPTAEMAAAGDAVSWHRMVEAALEDARGKPTTSLH